MSALNLKILEDAKKGIMDEIERSTALLVNGAAQDFTEYRYFVGGIKGLRDAITILDETVAAMREEKP